MITTHRKSFFHFYGPAILFAIIFYSTSLNAQWNFTLSTDNEYSTNPFRSPFPEEQMNSAFNLGIEKINDKVNFLYYGSYSHFFKTRDRDSYWHQLGFYTTNESTKLGAYFEQRINSSVYEYFNYASITGYIKHNLGWDFINTELQGSATYKSYNNLSAYNNILYTGGIRLNRSFETRTTFIVQSMVALKDYINTGTQSLSSGGRGKGMMATVADTQSVPSVKSSQIFSSLRIAQSVIENTGLAVYYQNRSLINGSGTWYGGTSYSYGDESDLYDDPISRDENTFGFEITQVLPSSTIIKTGYMNSSRTYPSQGIYTDSETLAGDINRNDTQKNFYFNVSKNFLLNEETGSSLNLNLNYNYINNSSNSFWYNYNLKQVSLNLGFIF